MSPTKLLTVFLLVASSGCASATPTPATPPTPTPQPPPETKAEQAGALLPGDAEKVPPPPAECSAFVEQKPTPAACDAKNALGLLANALAKTDARARDAELAALEACAALPAGLPRALRAELAPTECGDVLVEPYLAKPPAGLAPELRDALMGLGFAARAARLVREPPKLTAPFSKERVNQFVSGPLKTWIEGQAKAIYSVSLHGSNLEGYGKAVVAVEAGLADLRFVDVARTAPVPEDIAKDTELKDAYYGALEQALESRKNRGRDAALVGLKKLAEVGVINDPRVARARKLLSEVYSGRRIDALDTLLVPALAAAAPKTDAERLATLLPTAYAGLALGNEKTSEAPLLRALIERGLPRTARSKLEAEKAPSAESRRLLARALFSLGQRYWRAADFTAAEAAFAASKPTGAAKNEAELLLALTTALAGGPKDAAAMMSRGPELPKGVGDVAKLDALGKGKGERAGMALFDAARLLEIARPVGADAAYFKGIAERYQRAAAELADAATKKDALDRAKAAEETASAIAPH